MIFTPESSPIRESPPRRIADLDEKLIPEIDSYTPTKKVDGSSDEGGPNDFHETPAGCCCTSNVIDCPAHHDAATSITSLAPMVVAGTVGIVVYEGPMPGLNKYGNVPNIETSAKASRRRANRELKKTDPERYARETEYKKALRDDYLRSLRQAGFQ